MKFNLKLILILLSIISNIFASLNGKCSGRNGICISTSTCSNYGGQTFSGKCPSDPNDVKCCDNIPCTANDGRKGNCLFSNQCSGEQISGKCPGGNDFKWCVRGPGGDTSFNGPCTGGGGACINVDNTSCDTRIVSGKCPGSNSVKCCVAGNKPSWYINQNDYTKTLFSIRGTSPVDKKVSCCGCSVTCLSMAIKILKGTFISPEDLFTEAYKNNLYWGNGVGHSQITKLGNNHGVSVSWTKDTSKVYTALQNGKPVIFNVHSDSKYHFTSEGHYILLKGAKTQNKVQKVYVFDPNGRNNYINILFPLKSSDGGIEVAKAGFSDGDFGIVS